MQWKEFAPMSIAGSRPKRYHIQFQAQDKAANTDLELSMIPEK